MNIIKFFKDVIGNNNEETLSRAAHKIFKSIIDTLNVDQLHELQNNVELDWYLDNLVFLKLEGSYCKSEKKEQNKSWHKYLSEMQDRKSGHVTASREKLRRLFPHLEWRVQRKILLYFLKDATKSDRIWALRTIQSDWSLIGDCKKSEVIMWLTEIQHQWLLHHEKEAAIILIKHEQHKFVAEFEKELSDAIGYQKVALRLGENADYIVDRSRMTDLEWLYVMTKLKRTVEKQTCEVILTEVLLDAIHKNECPYSRENEELSFVLDSNIGLAIWCIGRLKYTDLIMDFYKHDLELCNSLKGHYETPDEEWTLMCKQAKYFFPLLCNYEKDILKMWMHQYPTLRILVEKLELKLI